MKREQEKDFRNKKMHKERTREGLQEQEKA
jgi:hypothetical protein